MTARRLVHAALPWLLMAPTVARAEVGAGAAPAGAVASAADAARQALIDYVGGQKSTGLVVIRNGKTLLEKSWPAPADDRQFALFTYGPARDGALLEDVASQQKSFVALLVAIALDKGLVDLDKPVSAYLGAGWSKATTDQRRRFAWTMCCG